MRNLQSTLERFALSRNRSRTSVMITTTLAVLVLFVVSMLLTKPADSMTGQLVCAYEAHIHSEECTQLVCTQSEHICDESCQATECLLTHVCDETCDPNGCTLVHICDENCQPQECTPHEHFQDCYELVCTKDEHEHSQDCYEAVQTNILSTYYNNAIQVMEDEQTATEATEVTDATDAVQQDVSGNEWFESAEITLPTNGIDVSDNLFSDGESSDYFTGAIENSGTYEDNKPVKFKISFAFNDNPDSEDDEFDQIKNGTQYLYYKLPEGVSFDGYKYGSDCYAEDAYGIRTFYYALAKDPVTDQEFIVFRILDSYIQNNIKNATVYKCNISFNTYVSRANTDDGDRCTAQGNAVVLGTGQNGQQFTVDVEFTDLKPTVKKSGKLIDNKDGKPHVEWTITIENPAPETKIVGFTLSDSMLSKAVEGSIKMLPENVFDSNWVLQDELVPSDDPITVTYQTPVDTATLYNTGTVYEKNTAAISKETASYPSNEASVPVTAAGYIWKEVKADYKYADGEIGNNYVWTLTVGARYGLSLAGFSVADEAIKTAEDITVLNGETVLVYGTDYTVDTTNGKLVFTNAVTASELKISYKNDKSITTNDATLHYPDDTPGPTATASCNLYDPYNMTKTGSYNTAGYAEWEIKVMPNDWNAVNLNGFQLTDTEFSNLYDSNGDGVLNESDIEVIGYATNGWEKTDNIDFTLSGNVITFSTDESITGYEHNPAGGVVVKIKTELTSTQEGNIAATLPAYFENTATFSNDNGFSESVYDDFQYDPVNKITKSIGTHTDTIIELDDISADKNETLDWTVIIIREHENGIESSSGTLVDVMQAKGTVDNEAQHYMDTDQREVKVYAKPEADDVESTGDVYTLLDSTYYTVTYYSDAAGTIVAGASDKVKSFSVTFLSPMDTLKYKAAKITYSTTADVSAVKTESGIEFTNTATFNGNEATPDDSYNVDVYDKENVPYTKSAIDKNKTEMSADSNEVNIIDVQTETIDGVKYYLFGWRIDFEYSDKVLTVKDTFDEGFTLCTDEISDTTIRDKYKPKIMYTWGTEGECTRVYGYDNLNSYRYDYEPNVVRFTRIKCSSVDYITYYTKIPASEFDVKLLESGDTGVIVKNNLESDNDVYTFDDISAEVHVTGEPDIPLVDMGDVVEKTYIPHDNNTAEDDKGTNNFITFEVDVNPDSKDLANGDELVLDDAFYTNYFKESEYSSQLTGVNLADVMLASIEVRKVISEDVKPLLSASDYSYQYYPGKTGEISVTSVKNEWDENLRWGFGNLQGGDVLTITLQHPTPNYVFNGTDNYVCYNFNGVGSECRVNNSEPFQFDSDGKYTFEVTVLEGASYFNIYANVADQLSDINISVSRTVPVSAANLSLTVPDATHLKVIYKYALLRNGVALQAGNIINFSNEVTLTGNGIASSKVENVKYTVKESDAGAGIEYLPTVHKLDTADYSVEGLEATFKFGRYNGTNWQWYSQLLASGDEIEASWSDDVNSATLITTNGGTNGGRFELNGLETGKLYVLVEMTEPQNIDGYKYEDASKIQPYYFSYATTLTSFPAGINSETLSTDNVRTIQQNGEIPVTNNRLVDISVTKTWDEPQNNASVKAELYWSYKKVLNGFPSEMTLATADNLGVDSITNPAEFSDVYKWSDLPNGKNGKPIYYYVKETHYTINGVENEIGTEFSPIYRGNGINSSDLIIQITNASSLQLKKVWCDINNVPLPDSFIPVDEVEVKLWGKKTALSTEELVMNDTEETFKITKADGWKLKLTPEQLDNYQYFTVEEIISDELTNYSVSYSENYEGQTGSITITNKADFEVPYTDITVKKLWYDGDGTNRPTSLELKLMQKTDTSDWAEAQNQTPVLEKNGNEWIFTYKNLLAKDSSGNTIYYKVEETVPKGYTLTEINNEGVNSTSEDDPIILANTKTLSIEIEKKWNESNHMLDKVLVDVYRTTNEDLTSPELVQENIEISATTSWKAVIDGLPAYDSATGKQYYYTVTEKPESVSQAYTPSYLYNNDENAKSITLENGKVVVTNSYIYEPVLLPVTGGNGTTIYYVIGMAVILIGCAAYIWTYKKSKSKK